MAHVVEEKQEPEVVSKPEEVAKLNGDGNSPRKLPVECEDLLDLLEDEKEPDNLNEEDEDSTSVRMTEDEESTTTSLPVVASGQTAPIPTAIGGATVEQSVVVNQIDSM